MRSKISCRSFLLILPFLACRLKTSKKACCWAVCRVNQFLLGASSFFFMLLIDYLQSLTQNLKSKAIMSFLMQYFILEGLPYLKEFDLTIIFNMQNHSRIVLTNFRKTQSSLSLGSNSPVNIFKNNKIKQVAQRSIPLLQHSQSKKSWGKHISQPQSLQSPTIRKKRSPSFIKCTPKNDKLMNTATQWRFLRSKSIFSSKGKDGHGYLNIMSIKPHKKFSGSPKKSHLETKVINIRELKQNRERVLILSPTNFDEEEEFLKASQKLM